MIDENGNEVPEEKVEEPKEEEKPEPKPAPTPAPAPAPTVTGTELTDEQMKALEKQTGFKREQLITMQLMINNSAKTGPAAPLIADRAKNTASQDLEALGITDFKDFSVDIDKEMKDLTIADKQNPELIKNVYWIVKGKAATLKNKNGNGGDGVASKGKIKTGVMSGGRSESDAPANDNDISSLSDDDKKVFKRYGFKNMTEWKEAQKKDIDTSHEQNWKPDFSRK